MSPELLYFLAVVVPVLVVIGVMGYVLYGMGFGFLEVLREKKEEKGLPYYSRDWFLIPENRMLEWFGRRWTVFWENAER